MGQLSGLSFTDTGACAALRLGLSGQGRRVPAKAGLTVKSSSACTPTRLHSEYAMERFWQYQKQSKIGVVTLL
jgi:hypothetical protein